MKNKYDTGFYILLIFLIAVSILYMKNLADYKAVKAWISSIEEAYDEKNKELDKKINSVDNKILELNDKYYEEKLIKLLGKEKLTAIAKGNWKYYIYMNGIQLKDDHIDISTNNITLTLSETQVGVNILPSNVQVWGSLTGGDKTDRFYDHLLIKSSVPYEKSIKVSKDGLSTEANYTFKDVPRGTIITIKLSEGLRERLNIMYGTLEIVAIK